MNRIFLDANVLFSAAYRPYSRLNDLWSLQGVELVTSDLAMEEARRNLSAHQPDALSRLEELADTMILRVPGSANLMPEGIELNEKDIHILNAAISAGCTHLITGDNQHFGHLFGTTISGVKVVTPAQYLRETADIQRNEHE